MRVTTRGRPGATGDVAGSSESQPAATRSAAGSPKERDPTLREVLTVLSAHLEDPDMLSNLTNPFIFEDPKFLLRTDDELRDLTKDVFGPKSGLLDTKKELYDIPSPKLRAECLKNVDAIRNAPENTGRRREAPADPTVTAS